MWIIVPRSEVVLFRERFRKKLYTSVEELQADLEKWVNYYNNERPHREHRNMGKRPIETIEKGKRKKAA